MFEAVGSINLMQLMMECSWIGIRYRTRKSGKYLCFNPLDADDPGRRPIVINSFLVRQSSPEAESDADAPELGDPLDLPL